ncbi:MAG: R2-like ligand-binding oxidase [Candidatus Dormibacteraeota bacterium]|nr:R2-like ligand-binding oxidase [Candidatus Dormibacteraeota bacterium]
MATFVRDSYTTTSAAGLRMDSVPMRLFQKAKRLGTWDPAALDFSQDRKDWQTLGEVERDFLLRLLALFQAGEEAVTVDLLPLIYAVAQDGHIEEEIYLTSFLWEEAKHVEMFRRWLTEVAEVDYDLHKFVTPSYRRLFFEELPTAMNRLLTEPTRENQAIASVTYNMVIEGMLAETGYYGFRRSLKQSGIMPGICDGIELTARDESRHIRYGVFLLQRLVSEDDTIWEVIKTRMNEIFPLAMAITPEYWESYDEDNPPFGLTMMEFVEYSAHKFDGRMRVLERDRGKSMAEIERAVIGDIEEDERAIDREMAEALA